jgi:vitamin K-dependent gamma-carboxylase
MMCLKPSAYYPNMSSLWFKSIDNTPLVLWRVIFGFLIATEAFGAIITGWVHDVLIAPSFTFNFIGFEFLQPLPGWGMYAYFFAMGSFGIMVLLGYRYRWAMFGFALLWSGVYLMQKTAYNNHYYLLMLLSWMMVLLPGHKTLSLDAHRLKTHQYNMPQWVKILFVAQVWIVFSYAAMAKIYPGWLDGSVMAIFMKSKINYPLIGPLLQAPWLQTGITYGGVLFDALIIPMLLWRRTRNFGFVLSLVFHLFNSVVFQIGIFPYMSIAFSLFFFPSSVLKKRFGLKRPIAEQQEPLKAKSWIPWVIMAYLVIQILLPLRHYLIQDSVLWTEEGHRLSWRMMLRSRSGQIAFWTIDHASGTKQTYPIKPLLTQKQLKMLPAHPDFIWQMAQKIKTLEAAKGREVSVYASGKVKVNGGDYQPFIDSEIDLAQIPWNPWGHQPWILPSPF